MLAPFWGDFDSHLNVPDQSVVWYHFYWRTPGVTADTKTMIIMDRATHDVRTFTPNTAFEAHTVIIITWANMKPYWQPVTQTEVNPFHYLTATVNS